MSDESPLTERSFLRRWSQRKLAAARESQPTEAAPPACADAAPPVAPASAAMQSGAASEPAAPLPAPETLSFESDFTPFLQASVDPAVRSKALRRLFADPRFNVMDGLDVYIDDYGKFEPIPPELVKELRHAKYLFDPPATRMTAEGHVEDVPDDAREPTELAAADAATDLPGEAAPAATGERADETRDEPVPAVGGTRLPAR